VYSQIVVPLDGEEFSLRAMGPALELAERSDADLVLVSFARTESHRNDLESFLGETVAGLAGRTSGKVVARVELVEDPAAAIVAEVERQPGSLVCMSSVGRPRSEPLLGSVAEAVLRDVSTPVLLIGPHADVDRFTLSGTIEVPVDGSALSEGVLPIAASWAIVYHLGLRVVTVVSATLTEPERLETWMESGYVRHIAEKLQRDVEKSVDFDVLHGRDIADRVLDDAARHATLLAVATHGRTGVARLAAGSVAMALVHRSTLPVLAYRPLELRG
jgi:nucleotide-binding universal stress UspA family protein